MSPAILIIGGILILWLVATGKLGKIVGAVTG